MSQHSSKEQMVIKLLMDVSERLRSSESERKLLWQELEEYRQIIADLEDKSSKTEQAYLSLEHKMGQRHANKLNEQDLEYRKKIDMSLRDAKRERELLNNKIEKASDSQKEIEVKLQENQEQTDRLTKKVEKVQSDKRRLLDRMSRVEDTVVFTKQALEAKAMVLLTDKSAAATLPSALPASSEGAHILNSVGNDNRSGKTSFFKNSTAIAASFVVLSLFAGIGIGQVIMNENQSAQSVNYATVAQADIDRAVLERESQVVARATRLGSIETASGVEKDMRGAPVEQKVRIITPETKKEMQALMEEVDEKLKASENLPKKDVASDAALATQLLAEPEQGTDAERILHVAKTVEEEIKSTEIQVERVIEPSAIAEVPKVVEIEPVDVKVSSDTGLGSVFEQARKIERQAITKLMKQRSEQPLEQRISTDQALPQILQEIEAKAFDGMAEAQHDLGAIYTAGHAGVERNFDRAVFWFKESAFRGIANARYNLGVLYHQGLGIEKDMDQAIQWYQAASYLKHPEAQYNLGIAYIEGIGTTYNPEMAAAYFEQAAMGGVVEAAYNLGLIYENSLLGVAQLDEALFWYKLAADQGNSDAENSVKVLSKEMGFTDEDVQKLVDQMKMLKPTFVENQIVQQKQAQNSADKKKELIRQVQSHLLESGFYKGNADGITGPMTEAAIESYQAQRGLEIDGKPTEELLVYMLAESLNYTNRPAAGN